MLILAFLLILAIGTWWLNRFYTKLVLKESGQEKLGTHTEDIVFVAAVCTPVLAISLIRLLIDIIAFII